MAGANSSRPAGAPEADIRPVVARHRVQAPVWLLSGVVVLGGILLFSVLDGQRRAATAPTTQVRTVDRVHMPSALPPLYLPPKPPPPPALPTGSESLAATPPFPPPTPPAPKRHGPGGGLSKPPTPQPPRARKVPYQHLTTAERAQVDEENRQYLRQLEAQEAGARGESTSSTGQTHAQQSARIRTLAETIPQSVSSEEEAEDPVPTVVRHTTPPHRGGSRSRSGSRSRLTHSEQGPSPAAMLQRRLWEEKSKSRSPSGGRPPSKDPQ